MPIAEMEISIRKPYALAIARQRARLHQHVLRLAPIAARIHPQRAADRTGHAREELHPRNARICRRNRHA
jgi:hypothetical protein